MYGAPSFKSAIKNALPSTEFKISLIKSEFDTTTTDGKIRFVSAVSDILVSVKDAVEVDAYIKKIAEEMDISKDAIYSEYRKKISPNSTRYNDLKRKNSIKPDINTDNSKELVSQKLIECQKRILGLIVSSKKLYLRVKDKIKVDEYATASYRRLAKAIYECYERDDGIPEESMLLNEFSGDENAIREITAVFYNMEVYDADEEALNELILSMELERVILQINNETDPVRLNELIKKRTQMENKQ